MDSSQKMLMGHRIHYPIYIFPMITLTRFNLNEIVELSLICHIFRFSPEVAIKSGPDPV